MYTSTLLTDTCTGRACYLFFFFLSTASSPISWRHQFGWTEAQAKPIGNTSLTTGLVGKTSSEKMRWRRLSFSKGKIYTLSRATYSNLLPFAVAGVGASLAPSSCHFPNAAFHMGGEAMPPTTRVVVRCILSIFTLCGGVFKYKWCWMIFSL